MAGKQQSKKMIIPTTRFTKIIVGMQQVEDMHAFAEQPDQQHCDGYPVRREAHELFTRFTAGIMKQNVCLATDGFPATSFEI